MTESFHKARCQRLLEDAEKERNHATLKVVCSGGESFSLHPCIAAQASPYFANYSNVQHIDAPIFRECRKFMYLGECSVTHENVSALLAAADFLLMEDLKEACFVYLEACLDHSNYETVKEVAEQFGNLQLGQTALRFSTGDGAKNQLVLKKQDLAKGIQQSEKVITEVTDKKKKLIFELDQLEEQWTAVLQKDIDRAIPVDENTSDGDEAGYPFIKAKPLGAVGRLVVDPDKYRLCKGAGRYDPNAAEEMPASERNYSRFRDAFYGKPPPRPTMRQYKKFGILYSYKNLEEALEDSKPGDRIYLSKGTHALSRLIFKQSQEIVALPGHDVRLVTPKYSYSSGWKVERGTLRLKGLSFVYRNGENARALIKFQSPGGGLFVQDCTFDMGTNAAQALPSRVSGIFLKQGEFARVERTKFIGGGGSAVTIVNEPLLFISLVELRCNSFVNTGQPSFSTRKKARYLINGSEYDSDAEWKEVPLEQDEIVPGPGAVEMWRLIRRRYRSVETQQRESYKTTTLILTNNHFHQNMRAALVYRGLSGVKRDGSHIYSDRLPKPKPIIQLWTDLSNMGDAAQGYEISLTDNLVMGNGLEFTSQQVSSWSFGSSSDAPSPKRSRTDNGAAKRNDGVDLWISNGIPDGESLLLIRQIVERDDHFPKGFSDSFPYDPFYFQEHFNI